MTLRALGLRLQRFYYTTHIQYRQRYLSFHTKHMHFTGHSKLGHTKTVEKQTVFVIFVVQRPQPGMCQVVKTDLKGL